MRQWRRRDNTSNEAYNSNCFLIIADVSYNELYNINPLSKAIYNNDTTLVM